MLTRAKKASLCFRKLCSFIKFATDAARDGRSKRNNFIITNGARMKRGLDLFNHKSYYFRGLATSKTTSIRMKKRFSCQEAMLIAYTPLGEIIQDVSSGK